MKKKRFLSVAVSSVMLAGIYNVPALAAETSTENNTASTVTYPIKTKLSDVEGKYTGSRTYSENSGPSIVVLSTQRKNVDSTAGQLQGSVTDPLTKAQYDAMKAYGTFVDDNNGHNLTSNINAIANGYAYNQGDEVDIDLNSRFVLSDEAAADGWSIKSITPTNLSGGLRYDRSTGHITGRLVEDVETGARDMRTDIVLSKEGQADITYKLRNYIVGAVIWKDVTSPTINQEDQTFKVGDPVSFDLGVSDNSFNKAFEKNTLKYNDDLNLKNTDETVYGANIGNQQMGVYVTGLPNGMSYDSKAGKVTGTATEAGIYNVSVLASDWAVDRTNDYGRTDLPNSVYKTFTITVKPTVEVTDVMSGATEVPVKVSAGSTKLTLTLPVDGDKTETVVMRKDQTGDTWTVVDNYETDKSGKVTMFTDNVGNKVTANNNEFNVPVLGVYATPGQNKIKAVVEAEQVTARLFGGEISDTGITAHYDTADKKWVTDTGDKDTAVTLRIPVNAANDSDVKVVTAKYTREYNSDKVLVKTEVVKNDHNTSENNWITVTRAADGTWKSSDGTQVKAVSSVDPDKTETNANGKWTVSGNFKFATTVDSVQNENVALANITNEAPSVTTKGGKVLVNSKVDLLASKYVTQITDKEDDNDKSDHKETTVTSVVVTSPTGEKVTLTPEEAKSFEIKSEGTYTVSVTVTDSDGLTAESTYNLEAAKEVPAKITVKFQKENGDKLGDDEVIDTKLGENYTTVPGDFIGYELTAIPSNAAGVVNDESVEVIYVYKEPTPNEASKGVIVTKYVTTDGKVLDPGSVTMYDVGEKYTTSAKDFSGYKLVETPSNANGVATDDVETVTYTYKEIKKLTVYFRDKNDNKVKDPVEITYLKGEDPVLPGTDVDGYTYIEKKTLDNGDIVYVYEQKSKVTARYVDKDGKDIDKEEIALYDKGSAYTTKAKEIEGYKLVKTPTNANGTADAAETTVTYEYRAIKKIKVFFEDTDKKSLKTPVELEYLDGESPVLPETSVDGYTYLRTVTLENGDLIYVFNKGNNVVEIEKPNTGDNSNVKIFSAILVIAGAIAGVVTFIRKKITK